jgi:hypothetical protein
VFDEQWIIINFRHYYLIVPLDWFIFWWNIGDKAIVKYGCLKNFLATGERSKNLKNLENSENMADHANKNTMLFRQIPYRTFLSIKFFFIRWASGEKSRKLPNIINYHFMDTANIFYDVTDRINKDVNVNRLLKVHNDNMSLMEQFFYILIF